jgi:hypothetical protein
MVIELANCGYIIILTRVKRIYIKIGLYRRISVFNK